MNAIQPRSRLATGTFAALVLTAYAASHALAQQLAVLPRADILAIALTLDLVVVVPAAFHFLVARPRRWPPLSVAPIVLLSVLAAGRILPPVHQQALRGVEVLLVPLELALVAWIAWRATRAAGAVGRAVGSRDADPLEAIHDAALETLRQRRVAAVIATEVGMFRYLFAGRGARPHVPAGARGFTHHERSGHGGLVLAAVLLIGFEGIAVHALVALWSPLLAWVLTVGSAWTAIWLVADWRATVGRPVLVTADQVTFRAGLRWTLEVPRSAITGIDPRRPAAGIESLSLAFLSAPTHWILLSEPCVARGPYGLTRTTRAIGVAFDDAEAFAQAIRA